MPLFPASSLNAAGGMQTRSLPEREETLELPRVTGGPCCFEHGAPKGSAKACSKHSPAAYMHATDMEAAGEAQSEDNCQRLIVPCCCCMQQQQQQHQQQQQEQQEQHQQQLLSEEPGEPDWSSLQEQLSCAYTRNNVERHAGCMRRLCRRYAGRGIPCRELQPLARLAEVYVHLALQGHSPLFAPLAGLCTEAARAPRPAAASDRCMHAAHAAQLVAVLSRLLLLPPRRPPPPGAPAPASAAAAAAAAAAGTAAAAEGAGSCVTAEAAGVQAAAEEGDSNPPIAAAAFAAAAVTPTYPSPLPTAPAAAAAARGVDDAAALRRAALGLLEAAATYLPALKPPSHAAAATTTAEAAAAAAAAAAPPGVRNLHASYCVETVSCVVEALEALQAETEEETAEEAALLRALLAFSEQPEVTLRLCRFDFIGCLLARCTDSLSKLTALEAEARAAAAAASHSTAAAAAAAAARPAAASSLTAAALGIRMELLLRLVLQLLRLCPGGPLGAPEGARSVLRSVSVCLQLVLSPRAGLQRRQLRNDLACVLLLLAGRPSLLPFLPPSGAFCCLVSFASFTRKPHAATAAAAGGVVAAADAAAGKGGPKEVTATSRKGGEGDSSSSSINNSSSRQKEAAAPEDVELLQLLWLCLGLSMQDPCCRARALHFPLPETLAAFGDSRHPSRDKVLGAAPWRFTECQIKVLGEAALICLGALAVSCPSAVVAAGGIPSLLRVAAAAAAAADADTCAVALKQGLALLEAPSDTSATAAAAESTCGGAREACVAAGCLDQLLQLIQQLLQHQPDQQQQRVSDKQQGDSSSRPSVQAAARRSAAGSYLGDTCCSAAWLLLARLCAGDAACVAAVAAAGGSALLVAWLRRGPSLLGGPPWAPQGASSLPFFCCAAAEAIRALALSSEQTAEAFIAAGGTDAFANVLASVPRRHLQPLLACLTEALEAPVVAAACRRWRAPLKASPGEQQQQQQQPQQQQQTLQRLLLQLWLQEQQRFDCLSPLGTIGDTSRPLRLRCLPEPSPFEAFLDVKLLCSHPGDLPASYSPSLFCLATYSRSSSSSNNRGSPWLRAVPEALRSLREGPVDLQGDLRFELWSALQQLSPPPGSAAALEGLSVAEAQQQLFVHAGDSLWRLEALTLTREALKADAAWLETSWSAARAKAAEVQQQQQQLASEWLAREAAAVEVTLQAFSAKQQQASERQRKILGLEGDCLHSSSKQQQGPLHTKKPHAVGGAEMALQPVKCADTLPASSRRTVSFSRCSSSSVEL
ncbi:hypothetical protein Efla_004800 [Eimeria flavescens]